MKSIFPQEKGQCFLCCLQHHPEYYGYTEEHHIFFGTANRKKSEKYGLKVKLCLRHHKGDAQGSRNAVHSNIDLNNHLKGIAQAEFEKTHTREEFRKEFGKSWL